MNKLIKWGLFFQVPNIIALTTIVAIVIISRVPWNLVIDNIGIIILTTIFGLFNIFSIICLVLGVIEEFDQEKKNKK